MQYTATYTSPLGGITLGSDGEHLTGLWFDGQKYFASTLSESHREENLPVFVLAKEWLDLYFQGGIPDFIPPLSLQASAFRLAVWGILQKIPYGTTVTYGQIAKRLALEKGLKSMSSQAVGGAVAHNPISVIIPCHRVIGGNGSLTGYAGGIERKRKLLQIEKIDTSRFWIPKKSAAL